MQIIIHLSGIIGTENGGIAETRQIILKGSISTKSVNVFFKETDLSKIEDPKEKKFFEAISVFKDCYPIERITFSKYGL